MFIKIEEKEVYEKERGTKRETGIISKIENYRKIFKCHWFGDKHIT